jgi:hypothetical protein
MTKNNQPMATIVKFGDAMIGIWEILVRMGRWNKKSINAYKLVTIV